MKKIYFLLLTFCFTTTFAQIVNIPDANFKAKLLAANTNNTIAKNSNNANIKIDVNNDLEIQVSEALLVYKLDVKSAEISDLFGIDAFSNLTNLNCRSNSIDNLDLGVLPNLTVLTCNSNGMTSLNLDGATNLVTLDCFKNDLTTLNLTNLVNLNSVDCNKNDLTSFNFTNCPNITVLDFSFNLFVELDVSGIANLYDLNCSNNQLTSISVAGLTNLYNFICANNQLPNLNVSGLENLSDFDCSNNQLPNLNVSGLTNLNNFNCASNQLSTLDVSGLNNLGTFNCSYNQLSSLDVSGLTNLFSFNCSFNQLTSLDLSNGSSDYSFFICNNNLLVQLLLPINTSCLVFNCSYNLLTSLPSILTGSIDYFNCSYNLLTTLNIESNIGILDCSHNQLTSLNFLNSINVNDINCESNQLENLNIPFDGSSSGFLLCGNNNLISIIAPNAFFNDFFCGNNSNLQYVCTNEDFASRVKMALLDNGYNNVEVNSYCTFTPGGTFYTIQGNHSFDFNNNGCDANDSLVPNLRFTITDGTTTGSIISDETGNYNIRVQAGSHTITPVLENPNYFTITPNTLPVVFPTQTSPVNQNFCMAPNGVHPDLEVVVIPTNTASPGFDVTYKIIYKNKGTTTQSGSINFAFDDAILDFVTSNPLVTSQVNNNLTWTFSNLQPFASGEIFFTMNLNSPMEVPAVNGDDVLYFSTTIASAATDETPSDNTATLSQTVFNSFDPNDKTCLEGSNITPEMIGNYVHYKIRFENTGTANAQRIIVSDKIDLAKFDISTLVPIVGSHVFTTRIYDGNKVEFIFENIQLPFDDANNDGYVVFKIKTLPTLTLGDSFSNSAAIYFDYNYPIFTNDAITTIQVLGTPDFEFGNYFTLYPNPTKDVLNLKSKTETKINSIAIYNTLGQLVIAIPNAQNTKVIDVSNLSTGNYFIKINSERGSSSTRFVKE